MSEPREWSAEEIKFRNVIRGPKTPEEAERMVEQWHEAFGNDSMDTEDAAFLLEQRRLTDADFEHEVKRLRLRPAGGRPPNPVHRDALIYCLRVCKKLEYYQIEKLLSIGDFKVPASPGARYAAKRAGLKKLRGHPCAHTELAKMEKLVENRP